METLITVVCTLSVYALVELTVLALVLRKSSRIKGLIRNYLFGDIKNDLYTLQATLNASRLENAEEASNQAMFRSSIRRRILAQEARGEDATVIPFRGQQ